MVCVDTDMYIACTGGCSLDPPTDRSIHRWIQQSLSIRVRQIIHPLLFPSIYRSVSWSIHHLCICLSIHPSIYHRSLYLSIFPSISIWHYPAIYAIVCLHLSIYRSTMIDLSIDLSIDSWIHVPIFNLSIHLAVYLSSRVCIYPSSQFFAKNQIAFYKPAFVGRRNFFLAVI